MDPSTVVPEAARVLPRPIVGYFGSIASWIDVELIAWLASSCPHWTLLLVGQALADVGPLRALPNVVLPGPQPYEALPAWARAFDVAIIPYRLNQQVRHANPLKLREYLATGRPIVSVSNPEIERFSQWVRIAPDREGFLREIELALEPEPPGAALGRIAAVEHMTWDGRMADVLAHVAQRLQSPGAGAAAQT
jgi:glycosyltransferase involved in cell wall biosynthesis